MDPERTVAIGAAIDDAYAIPLLVALRSAAHALAVGWGLDVHVIANDVTSRSRERLVRALDGLPVTIRWYGWDLSAIRDHWPGIRSDGDLTVYHRLYLGEALPRSVRRVLFLDADLLVRGDLSKLWGRPFDGSVIQAVPDAYAPTLHAPRLARVASALDVSFGPDQDYFNAGVMLIALDEWREGGVRERAEELLWSHASGLFMRDQDALNLALAGRWKPLPATWNFHELPHWLGVWDTGDAAPSELRRTFENPDIIHFIGRKPWDPRCGHVYAEAWRSAAAEVDVRLSPLSTGRSIAYRLFTRPHARLHWHLWRRIVQGREPSELRGFSARMLRNPWTLVTYPLWSMAMWVRSVRMRRRAPIR
ncbi:MAG: glycosyltransferase family 8 protein [Gemmatimonadetes bacterium]|nr:glycosyltransferase family 8 protein [Gemmatimonadota bacterium]